MILAGGSSTSPSNASWGRPARSTTQPVAGAPSSSTRATVVVRDRVVEPDDEAARLAEDRGDDRALDPQRPAGRRARRTRDPAAAHPLDRHQELVGRVVQAGVLPRAAVGEQRVLDRDPPLELRALERVERAGRVRPQRDAGPRQVAGRPQQGERELAALVDELVLEQAVVQDREPERAVRRVDEAAGDERRQRRLVRAALGGEPPLDDRERALGRRTGRPAPAAGSAPAAGGRGPGCRTPSATRRNRSPDRSSSVVVTGTSTVSSLRCGAQHHVADRARRATGRWR